MEESKNNNNLSLICRILQLKREKSSKSTIDKFTIKSKHISTPTIADISTSIIVDLT